MNCFRMSVVTVSGLLACLTASTLADAPPKAFTTWQQMYVQVPEDIRPADAKTMSKVQVEVVNKSLAQNVQGKDAILEGIVKEGVIETKGAYKGRPRIWCEDEIVSGVQVVITFNFKNTDDGKTAVARANKGQYIQASGKVGVCYFIRVDKKVHFVVDLDECEIIKLGKK